MEAHTYGWTDFGTKLIYFFLLNKTAGIIIVTMTTYLSSRSSAILLFLSASVLLAFFSRFSASSSRLNINKTMSSYKQLYYKLIVNYIIN